MATNGLDLLVIPSLASLGRVEELSGMAFDTDTELGQFASELIRVLESDGDLDAAITGLAVEHAELFEDLTGSLLLRALTIADPL